MFDTRQKDCAVDELFFELTCHACLKQYVVFYGEKEVACVRLRHGELKIANLNNGEI